MMDEEGMEMVAGDTYDAAAAKEQEMRIKDRRMKQSEREE